MASTQPRCPDCDGQLRTEAEETVCSDCGLVVDTDRIDHGPEWRSFDDSRTNPKRTGAPLTEARHDRGLSTKSATTETSVSIAAGSSSGCDASTTVPGSDANATAISSMRSKRFDG